MRPRLVAVAVLLLTGAAWADLQPGGCGATARRVCAMDGANNSKACKALTQEAVSKCGHTPDQSGVRLASHEGVRAEGCDMEAARQKLIQEYDVALRSSVAKALNNVDVSTGATPATLPNVNQLLLAPQGPAGRGLARTSRNLGEGVANGLAAGLASMGVKLTIVHEEVKKLKSHTNTNKMTNDRPVMTDPNLGSERNFNGADFQRNECCLQEKWNSSDPASSWMKHRAMTLEESGPVCTSRKFYEEHYGEGFKKKTSMSIEQALKKLLAPTAAAAARKKWKGDNTLAEPQGSSKSAGHTPRANPPAT